jgi:hypothetical protein
MTVDYFRIPPGQTDLSHVTIVADDGKMRAVGRISRDIIEDIAPNEEYRQKRFDIVERNLPVLAGIIRRKYEEGAFTDYTDSLGVTSGNDKLVEIERDDLVGHTLE